MHLYSKDERRHAPLFVAFFRIQRVKLAPADSVMGSLTIRVQRQPLILISFARHVGIAVAIRRHRIQVEIVLRARKPLNQRVERYES